MSRREEASKLSSENIGPVKRIRPLPQALPISSLRCVWRCRSCEALPLLRSEWSTYFAWAVEAFRIASSGVRDDTPIHTHMCYAEFQDIIEPVGQMDADVMMLASISGLSPYVYDALVVYTAGGVSAAQIRKGARRVADLQREMDRARRERLQALGFEPAVASEMSAYHTKNFM
jgi:hypothetical protein